jgi:hypothetical protein
VQTIAHIIYTAQWGVGVDLLVVGIKMMADVVALKYPYNVLRVCNELQRTQH